MSLFVPTFQNNNNSRMNGDVKEIVYKKALTKEVKNELKLMN